MKLTDWVRWRPDRDLDEEIAAHVDLEIQANLERGMTREEARLAASRRFGNRARVMEGAREADPLFGLETFGRDVAYGLRQLRRNPGFTFAAAASLALGIAANALIFSLLDTTLLKPLGLPEADRLVVVWNVPDRDHPDQLGTHSISRYEAFRDQTQSFASVAAFNGFACGIKSLGADRNGAAAEQVFGQTFSPSMFPVLGVSPLMGRIFTDEEDQADQVAPVVVISHRSWQRRFGGDPQILGRSVTMNRIPTTVIGVMPEDFDFFGGDLEFFAPLCLTRAQVQSRVGANSVLARLKAGVSLAQAQAEIESIAGLLAKSDPARHGGMSARLEPVQRAAARLVSIKGVQAGDYSGTLWMLQGAVGCVLFIACANVAGLLLARGAGRRREVGLRLALGASRGRLVRQLITENVPLAMLGGVLAVVLAWSGLSLFVATAPPDFPRLDRVSLDVRVLGFTAIVIIVTSMLSALVPSLQASRVGLVGPLNDVGRTTAGPDRQRLRRILVAGQIAVALILITGAGLLLRSFVRVVERDLGADPSHLLTFGFGLPLGPDTAKNVGTYHGFGLWEVSPTPALTFDRVFDRLQQVPGVVSAAAVSAPPFGGPPLSAPFAVDGRAVSRASAASDTARESQPTTDAACPSTRLRTSRSRAPSATLIPISRVR